MADLREKDYSLYDITCPQPSSWEIPKEEELYNPERDYHLQYERACATSTPYDSIWRHRMAPNSQSKVRQFEPD